MFTPLKPPNEPGETLLTLFFTIPGYQHHNRNKMTDIGSTSLYIYRGHFGKMRYPGIELASALLFAALIPAFEQFFHLLYKRLFKITVTIWLDMDYHDQA
jgi:hypothetical protein